jgi:hypothetical protein
MNAAMMNDEMKRLCICFRVECSFPFSVSLCLCGKFC